MTPPAKPAASGSVSADAKVETPPPPAVEGPKKPEDKKAADAKKTEEKDPPRLEWKFSLGFGPETMGGRNGGLFAIDNISQFGDFTHYLLNGALMHDFNSGTFRVRGGGQLQFDGTKGNENTGGSSLWNIGLGPRIEFDWKRAYGDGLGGVLVGPASLGIYGILGYGWGTTNVDGGFQLHKQSGFGTAVGADVNVVGFNVGNVHIGADFFAQTNAIYGGDFNNAGWALGGLLTFRPSTKKMVRIEERRVPTCEDDLTAIARQEKKVIDLRKKNEDLTLQIGELRYYLEAHPKHAFTPDRMRKALVLGAVAEELVKQKVDKAKIAEMVKQGTKEADITKLPAIVAKTSGVSEDAAKELVGKAEARYPSNHDFWKADADPEFQLKPDIPKNPENCPDLQKYRDDLEEAIGKLERRNGQLDKLYETAVHLAGLFLGEESVKEILSATIINIDTPSFKTARPNENDMKKLKGGTSADAIAKDVFSVSDHEMKKLDQLADWLNGKIEYLPGEERTREILNKEFGQKAADSETPEAKDALKKFHMQLSLGIFGHTDSDGGDKANEELSQRRAEFIKAYLVSKGVDEKRLVAKGFGEKYPAMPEGKGSAQDRLIAKGKNRRVEFVPVGVSGPSQAHADQNPDHVDAKQVPKSEGGTGGDKKDAPAPKKDAPAPKKDAPAPKKDTPPPPPAKPKKDPDF